MEADRVDQPLRIPAPILELAAPLSSIFQHSKQPEWIEIHDIIILRCLKMSHHSTLSKFALVRRSITVVGIGQQPEHHKLQSYSGGLDLTSRITHSGYRPFGHFCLFYKEIGTFGRDERVDLRLSAMSPSIELLIGLSPLKGYFRVSSKREQGR